MKEITVYALGEVGAIPVAHAHGEAMLDTNEGTLIIHGPDVRKSMTFNWDNILSYTESPMAEEGEQAE